MLFREGEIKICEGENIFCEGALKKRLRVFFQTFIRDLHCKPLISRKNEVLTKIFYFLFQMLFTHSFPLSRGEFSSCILVLHTNSLLGEKLKKNLKKLKKSWSQKLFLYLNSSNIFSTRYSSLIK